MGVIPFLVKTAEHSVWCGQVHALVTHHAMGQHVERISKKNSLKPNVASHNNASWYTDTDRFLEHSPSGGSSPEDNSGVFFGGGHPSYQSV